MAGESLKIRREELGFNIKEISDALKIRPDYLKAIEDNMFEMLPVEIYTKGYIRCYAKHLGIDPEPIIQDYKKHLLQSKPAAALPAVSSNKRSSLIFRLSWIFIIIAIVFFIFHNMSVKQAVIEKQNINNLPAVKPADTSTENADNKQQPNLALKAHLLSVSASEATWIYIKFSDNRSEEVLLKAGQSKNWKFPETALLKIGNAGGVKADIDGKDFGLLGKSGQVITLKIPLDR